MRVLQGSAAALCCVIVVASLPAEARGGRGRSIGSSRIVAAPSETRVKAVYVAPQPRTLRGTLLVGRRTTAPSPLRHGVAAGAPGAFPDAIPAGTSLAAPEVRQVAHGACPAERLVGSGAGFCQLN
ncbi:MAG TPA: hypothetical protein VE686_08695 [Beijerinckiaceae bacterium]|nr:hypothetical protein [Beijerinckiaceae bacterium]